MKRIREGQVMQRAKTLTLALPSRNAGSKRDAEDAHSVVCGSCRDVNCTWSATSKTAPRLN